MPDYREIPLLPRAHYEINVGWHYLERHFQNWERSSTPPFLDPDYQRVHVWTEDQQRAYVEYQLMGGDVSRTLIFNAPFWSRLNVPVDQTYVELLDGKQRLEAVRAFVRGDLAVFGKKFDEFEGKFPVMDYRFRFHVCRLETREEVLRLYLSINAGGTPHSRDELDRVRRLLEKENDNHAG